MKATARTGSGLFPALVIGQSANGHRLTLLFETGEVLRVFETAEGSGQFRNNEHGVSEVKLGVSLSGSVYDPRNKAWHDKLARRPPSLPGFRR